MKIAFYKGRTRLFDRLVQWWTRSPYSHCEIVFDSHPVEAGTLCASSSKLDGGVRFKIIELKPERWDIIDLPLSDENAAFDWFLLHSGEGYDVLGLLGFVLPIVDRSNKWFCSEACAQALGFTESWRYSPAILHSAISRHTFLTQQTISEED